MDDASRNTSYLWEDKPMFRQICVACIMTITFDASALAQDQCVAPAAPALPDGTKATRDQILLAQNDIKKFAAAADNFQHCVASEITRQKDLAKQNNVEVDPNIEGALQARAVTQRKDSERLATAWGAAVQAFNDAQQKKQQRPQTPSQSPAGGGYGGGYGGAGRY